MVRGRTFHNVNTQSGHLVKIAPKGHENNPSAKQRTYPNCHSNTQNPEGNDDSVDWSSGDHPLPGGGMHWKGRDLRGSLSSG